MMSTEVFNLSFQLMPTDISSCYSLSEIETEITAIKAAITLARQSLMDKFSDMQASQMVQRPELKSLYSELALYVKAKNILTGADSSTAVIVTPNYNPSIPKI